MSQLSAAAQALNAPESIVQRSAEARSKATGVPIEDILAAWAGGAAAPSASAPAPSPTAPPAAPTTAAEAVPAEVSTPAAAPAPIPAVVTGVPAVAAITPLPQPATVTPEEALAYPVIISVPTAGLRERTTSALPRWLAAAFLIIPAFGLLYFSGNAGAGGCVEGGFELAVDRVAGVVENCDGSDYEGKGGIGGGAGQFLAEGAEIYATCAGCHGAGGAGAGAFPALTNVTNVFSRCSDHIEWVTLGTLGFQTAGRATYGDTAKPVGGSGAVMPAYATSLTPEQIASVIAYERVSFGGGEAETVLVDCGLVEGEEATSSTTGPTETTAAPSAGLTRHNG
jgi:Cytochrome c